MHKLKVLILGPESFLFTLNELKQYLKFELNSKQKDLQDFSLEKFDSLICHEEQLEKYSNFLSNVKCVKVLAASKTNKNSKNFDYILSLPTSVKEINELIESSEAKKKFNKNSSIKIKTYLLDKNEKKLMKGSNFIVLTEKEIQLLELFLSNKAAISKKNILSLVWNYSTSADTHTVETHIYRLRKKIKETFDDEEFIVSTQNGYKLN